MGKPVDASKEPDGFLWEKKDKLGDTFFSGVLKLDGTDTEVMVFRNKYRETEKSPTHKLYFAEYE